MNIRKLAAGFIAMASVLVGGVVVAPPASAATVVRVLSSNSNINFNNPLATCSAPAGFTCTISKSYAATRTINVAFGVSRSFVSAQLGISSATTRSVTVSCSKVMPPNRSRLVAYPAGRQIFYTITSNGQTSGTLMAFEPEPASVACFLYA
ncbi:hypothetical protein [Blastococcus sp. CT_GayMR16]|uniref:hypothetical protein n=1 Tax=Blastococcus sp. CT_GayMR16 TaxID=2559607 RepID=UPI0010740D99|nr:hypothetical protein [Blastococcus sp. CT_GayMR16]TFV86150.1 hypothetical protein E4P38_18010 [Blastococcus sp. CT_GayMR16]